MQFQSTPNNQEYGFIGTEGDPHEPMSSTKIGNKKNASDDDYEV